MTRPNSATALCAALVSFACTTLAQAAPVAFDLTGSPALVTPSITQTVDGLTLTMTSGYFTLLTPPTTGGNLTRVADGLGVKQNRSDEPLIDNKGVNDLVFFAFSAPVDTVTLCFSNVDRRDDYIAFVFDGMQYNYLQGGALHGSETLALNGASGFALGAAGLFNSEFRIRHLSVTPTPPDLPDVPLPATAVLMMGAIGSLAALRRKARAPKA